MADFDIHNKPSDDNARDEVINIRLPRADYEILRKMIDERIASSWFENWVRGHWVWVIGGGILTIILLWDKVHLIFAAKV